MGDADLETRSLAVGPFRSNCHLIRRRGAAEALVIDPGAEASAILEALEEWGARPKAILLTHAHLDHIGAISEMLERKQVPVYLHPEDLPLYERASEQAVMFGLRMLQPPLPSHDLEDGQQLDLAGLSFEVRHTPGHSPGHVVFAGPGLAFVGDCVFAGSIGRTDLPGGDAATLLRSIRDKILSLPPDTVLHTGHGSDTRVSVEAASNPFLLDTSWAQ